MKPQQDLNVTKKVLTRVISPITRDLFSQFIGKVIRNDDEILKEAKGDAQDIYYTMPKKDPHLTSVMETRLAAMAALPRDIIAVSEDPEDVEKAELVKQQFARFENFEEDIKQTLSGIFTGFSISELIWEFTDRWWVDALEARRPRRFVFGLDGRPRLVAGDTGFEGEELPDFKFLLLRHQPEAENPYGTPLLQSVYWYWWFKKLAIKFWAVHLERYGQPMTHLKYPPTADPDEIKRYDDMVENIQQNTAFATPSDVTIDTVEAQRSAQSSYDRFIEVCNSEMSKVILGMTLTTEVQQVGARATAETQKQMFESGRLRSDARLLEAVFNKQLIRWFIDLNFGPQEKYPRLVFKADPDESLDTQIERVKTLISLGMPVSIPWARQTFGVPEPEKDAPLLKRSELPSSFGGLSAGREIHLKKRGQSQFQRFRRELGRIPAVPAPSRSISYDLSNVASIRRRFAKDLELFFATLGRDLQQQLKESENLRSVVSDVLSRDFADDLATPLTGSNHGSLRAAAVSVAAKLEVPLSEDRFAELFRRYAARHAYGQGAARDMAGTIREAMLSHVDELLDSNLGVDELRDEIMNQWKRVSAYRAELIAETETRLAANWAAIEVAKESPEPLAAWFVGPSTDEPLCMDLMAANPHDLADAQETLLPHPNCKHRWVFSTEES